MSHVDWLKGVHGGNEGWGLVLGVNGYKRVY